MRLLDRYLLRELLIPFFYCLGGFILFYDAFSLFSELSRFQDSHLKLLDVLELYANRLPGDLSILLPITLLLALLYALTNHARHHEITAIRAAGVSLWRLSAPYFVTGLLLSLAVFYMNEYLVPDSAEHEAEILKRYQGKTPRDVKGNTGFTNDRDGRKWTFLVYDLSKHIMFSPAVIWKTNGMTIQLHADVAIYTNDVWTFYSTTTNVEIWEFHAERTNEPVTLVHTNELAMPGFSETPDQIKRELHFATRTAKFSSLSSQHSIADLLDYLDLHPKGKSAKELASLRTELYARTAAPWTSLVVVLIAIPFGAASGRRNVFVGVASSIAICFVYFFFLIVGQACGTGQLLPPWFGAWLANISFTIAGVWLMLRVR
jgi:lipopolysaccharide export system permease protein